MGGVLRHKHRATACCARSATAKALARSARAWRSVRATAANSDKIEWHRRSLARRAPGAASWKGLRLSTALASRAEIDCLLPSNAIHIAKSPPPDSREEVR